MHPAELLCVIKNCHLQIILRIIISFATLNPLYIERQLLAGCGHIVTKLQIGAFLLTTCFTTNQKTNDARAHQPTNKQIKNHRWLRPCESAPKMHATAFGVQTLFEKATSARPTAQMKFVTDGAIPNEKKPNKIIEKAPPNPTTASLSLDLMVRNGRIFFIGQHPLL